MKKKKYIDFYSIGIIDKIHNKIVWKTKDAFWIH